MGCEGQLATQLYEQQWQIWGSLQRLQNMVIGPPHRPEFEVHKSQSLIKLNVNG